MVLDNLSFSFEAEFGHAKHFFITPISSNTSSVICSFVSFSCDHLALIVGCAGSLIRHVKDMYMELFFISGIFPLWLASIDFEDILIREIAEELKLKRGVRVKSVSKLFRQMCHLANAYNMSYGSGLFWYFFQGVIFYSINIGRYFQPHSAGDHALSFEYLITLLIICLLAAGFAHNVRPNLYKFVIEYKSCKLSMPSKKNILIQNVSQMSSLNILGKISKKLGKKETHILTHVISKHLITIRAHAFSITFLTLSKVSRTKFTYYVANKNVSI